jgi:hypothetical protein
VNGSQFAQYFESGAVWEPMVEHDQVDPVTARSDKGLGARCRGADLIRLAQEESDDFGNDRVIVNRQDLPPPDGHPAIFAIWVSSRREHRLYGRRFRDVNAPRIIRMVNGRVNKLFQPPGTSLAPEASQAPFERVGV